MRELDLDLIILENENWEYEGKLMIQEGVLDYFKENLFYEKPKGFYIINKHGELAEKAFLKVYGFPIHISNAHIDISAKSSSVNDGLGVSTYSEKRREPVFIPIHNVYRWGEDVLWTLIDNIPSRFKGAACVKLAQFWLEEGDAIFWNLENIKIFCGLDLQSYKPIKIEFLEPPLDKR